MKLKTTLILVVVFAGLLALVLVFDRRGEKKKTAEEASNALIGVAAADVRKISVERGPEPLVLERDEAGGPWRLTSPLRAAADESEANGVAEALASLKIERVVEKEAKDLKAYEIPTTTVSLWVKGKEAPIRLLVGMENPLDKSLFAKREDDPRLVLLPSSMKTTLDKSVFDLREKDVFKFAAADVTGVRVKAKAPDAAWQAAREDGGWRLTAPVASLAAKSKIDTLLESLSGLRAKAFVAETKTPETLKEFGLDKPDYEVALTIPATSREIVFALHKKGESQYATTSQSTKIVAFDGTLLADLDRKAGEMREKKAAEFYSWDADRVALKRGGFEIAAVKEKAGDTDKWVLEGPAKAEADRTKVEDFLRKVEGLEASSFVDHPGPLSGYGLDPGAEIRIRARDAQGKDREIVLLVGSENAEKKQAAVTSPGLGYLLLVDASFLQEWPKEAKDWQPAPPAAEEKPAEKK